MTPCGEGLELYARIPDSAPDVQWLVLGAVFGWALGASTFLFWWFFWKRQA